ncbi:sensor histidine kinase [Nocardioides sp. SR21]|uniref:sensor histidine kinase n=1 Tax=Nocardioides sp. SR21 TaxID=2919501 RepID=UPI001FA9958D|nr:histidine kinase [Nocardioides sp. SR21]
MSAIDAVAEERRRVARELHDGVGQHLVLLGYLVDEVAALVGEGPLREGLVSLRDEVGRAAVELREALTDLRGPQGTLSASLSAYADEVRRRSGLRIHLRLDERGPRWPAEVEREVLRVAQEAIANVHQHARAINVWVGLTTDVHQLLLVVEDDGIGRVAPREGHFGLSGMGERAERIGADLEIGPRRDGGTLVRLRVPGVRTALTPEGDGHDRPCVARR